MVLSDIKNIVNKYVPDIMGYPEDEYGELYTEVYTHEINGLCNSIKLMLEQEIYGKYDLAVIILNECVGIWGKDGNKLTRSIYNNLSRDLLTEYYQ